MTTATQEEPKTRNAAFNGLDDRFEHLPLEQLVPSPTNPRTHFDGLENLFASVKAKGVLNAILVRPFKGAGSKNLKGPGPFFEIIAGECRYRAAKASGTVTHVRAVIHEHTDEEVLEIQLEENLHRKDLTALEEGTTYRRLMASNPDKHSAAAIGARIGQSAGYVWDRAKLLDLIPEAKTLLEEKRVTVSHAILIARQKPEAQKKIINDEALFEDEEAEFEFDVEPGAPKPVKSKYDGMKLRTVRELETWIAEHIRFDVAHAAKAAPLEFEPVQEAVIQAEAQPGRGKKVISITYDSFGGTDPKTGDRFYGAQTWKRADGKLKSKTCEHSTLGVVDRGARGYGQAFAVCVAQDKCRVHFGERIKNREKNERDRRQAATGPKIGEKAPKPKSAAQLAKEQKAREKEEAEQLKAVAEEQAWKTAEDLVVKDAIAQISKAKTLTAAQAKEILNQDVFGGWSAGKILREALGATWFKTPAAAILVLAIAPDQQFSDFDAYRDQIARPMGLDIKRLRAIVDKHMPKPEPAKAAAKGKKATKVA